MNSLEDVAKSIKAVMQTITTRIDFKKLKERMKSVGYGHKAVLSRRQEDIENPEQVVFMDLSDSESLRASRHDPKTVDRLLIEIGKKYIAKLREIFSNMFQSVEPA